MERVIDVVTELDTLICSIPVPDDEAGLYVDEIIVTACSALPGDVVASTMCLADERRNYIPAGSRVVLKCGKGLHREQPQSTYNGVMVTVKTRDGQFLMLPYTGDADIARTAAMRLDRRPSDWELEGPDDLGEFTLTLTGPARLRGLQDQNGEITIQCSNGLHAFMKNVRCTGISAEVLKAWAIQELKMLLWMGEFQMDKKWYYPGDVAYLTSVEGKK